jgi:hypothetical protein
VHTHTCFILEVNFNFSVKPTISEPPPTVEEKGNDKINGDVQGTQKPPIIRKSPICHHCGLNGHVRPQCSLLKAQRAKVNKELPRQANYDTRPLAQYQTFKHQGIRSLGIKPLIIMHHGTRHLSSDLYLPIIVANPRPNPSTLKKP